MRLPIDLNKQKTDQTDIQSALRGFNFAADLHCFTFGGLRITVDVVSGAVHVVDQPTWDLLDALKKCQGSVEAALTLLHDIYPAPLLDEVVDEICRLTQEEVLFTRDSWRESPRSVDLTPQPVKPVIKSLCLHMAHDCNLRCSYCFGGGGGFGGQRGLMSTEVGRSAIDLLIEYSSSRRQCEVDFFGGEPLLNMPVVKEIVAYARRKGEEAGKSFRFTLTTNAVLLDEEIGEYLNRQEISLVMSVDGRREVHDCMRVYVDGSGSYDEVMENARALAESRGHQNYYVRGTYTRHNRDFTADVMHLADQGFRYISVEPVVAPETEEYALTERDLPTLLAEYEKLAAICREKTGSGQGFKFFHFDLDLEHGPCLPKRLKGCGAGFEYLAVTPEGDIYPCHQFVGRDAYLMGSVLRPGLDLSTVENFRHANILHKPTCANCWLRYYCGGGCHANADAFNHSLYQPYALGCSLQAARIEAGIYLQVAAKLDNR